MFARLVGFRYCQITRHPERSDRFAKRSGHGVEGPLPYYYRGHTGGIWLWIKAAPSGRVLPVPRSPRTSSWAKLGRSSGAGFAMPRFFNAFECHVQRLFRRNFHTPGNPRIALQTAKPPEFPNSKSQCTNPSSLPCGRPALHSKHTTYNPKVFIDSKNRRCTNTIVLRHI